MDAPIDNPLARDLDHVLDHTESLWQDARGQSFFITGGTGFVGTWLTESLLWANRRFCLGLSAILLTRHPDAFRARSPHLAGDASVTLLEGDAAGLDYPAGEFPFVIHAAAEPYYPPEVQNPAVALGRHVEATRRVLELAQARGARRFLFTSSGAVYGKQPLALTHLPEDYTGAPATTDPGSGYGQGKRISEFLCAAYARAGGFQAPIARLFAFVGPYLPLDENYAAGNFLRDALAGGPIRVAGDGTPYRSYLYAADLAVWLWTILFRGESGVAYNVGSPEEVTIADLARKVADLTEPAAKIRIAGQRVPGAPAARYVPSTDRAQAALGLRAWIPLEQALRRTYDWHLAAKWAHGNR